MQRNHLSYDWIPIVYNAIGFTNDNSGFSLLLPRRLIGFYLIRWCSNYPMHPRTRMPIWVCCVCVVCVWGGMGGHPPPPLLPTWFDLVASIIYHSHDLWDELYAKNRYRGQGQAITSSWYCRMKLIVPAFDTCFWHKGFKLTWNVIYDN